MDGGRRSEVCAYGVEIDIVAYGSQGKSRRTNRYRVDANEAFAKALHHGTYYTNLYFD